MKYKIFITGLTVFIGTLLILTACQTTPNNVEVVKSFDISKYTGNWFEIARLDFRFEKNLNNTTADYSLNDDGTIKVVNRGYNYKKQKWVEATGKAKFVEAKDEGRLKVSFFGPFYSGYNVIAIDPDYKYALIAGESMKYLWLLSRETTMPENIKQAYLKKAEGIGYKTSDLVWVEHNRQ
ncbi:lipocalin family protein [Chryseolinea sp. H1M3-3]|uniref:lipocalin family protein n=1 Tax=Chryseolinea sp. H1M3-3 TaxID=3034144 RepID=UPI0023EAE5EA|nr:lipocalin family protein [Chryseolinea sp. H1M3-3]